jgi:phenylacetate-CoA ligase
LVEAALEREIWSQQLWRAYQQERLDYILRRAVTKVPFYQELWEKRKAVSDKSEIGNRKSEILSVPQLSTLNSKPGNRAQEDLENLQNWPVLKKSVLRSRPEAFVAEDCDRRRMFSEHTSGTTGTPLTLWQSRDTVRQWYALFEARWRRWYGFSRHDRWAIIGGQLVTRFEQKEPPFWVWNAASHQLYLSAYHIAPRSADAYFEALKKHRVTYLWTYSSSAHALAQFILDQNLRPPELKAVITNAEPLYQHQREIIAKAFQCRVFETYGMSEMVCAASECLHGRLHLWPEAGVCEVLRDDADVPVEPGETGRLVCTGLLNADMPLIRYEVGDRVLLAEPDAQCPCGRTLPLLKSVEGRNDDVIVTPEGRRIGRLDPVFKANLPISEAQVIQDANDHLRVLVVPAEGFGPVVESSIIRALRERVEGMRITLEKVSSIPRSKNGKFKAVVSLVSPSSIRGAMGEAANQRDAVSRVKLVR